MTSLRKMGLILMSKDPEIFHCRDCLGAFEQNIGRGRKRVRCEACALIAKADAAKASKKSGSAYQFECCRCGVMVEALVGETGRRKKFCDACRGVSGTVLRRKTKCRDCNGIIEPGLMATCASCQRKKERERDRRNRDARRARNAAGAINAMKKCPSCQQEKASSSFHRNLGNWDGLASRCTDCTNELRRIRLSTPEGRLSARIRRHLRSDRPARRIDWNIRRALRGQNTSKALEDMFGYSLAELRYHLERQFTKGMDWDRFVAGEIHIDHILPVSSFDLTDVAEVKACYALPNLRPAWALDNLSKGAARTHLI
ncbi:hypothetical protein [Paracoccus aerius]|uniref:HNH endonuclease n=2 Tax=Paracoccus aerius TaxID=1915382 RepID=A0ABS1S652_9RHOB|nr:hypothetical protein [Paracoccus aerius]MBL3673599.1 hypothetical protein [Paracoccus aerius]